MTNCCYTINHNKGYFRIRFKSENGPTVIDYPLTMVREYKSDNDMTYQQVANALRDMHTDFHRQQELF